MTLLEKFREYARLLRIWDGRGAAIFYELHKQDSKFDAVVRVHAAMALGAFEGIREARSRLHYEPGDDDRGRDRRPVQGPDQEPP